MGYNLAIGEATIEWNEDMVRIGVKPMNLPEAPAFNEPTDFTNTRWPSYTAWSDFCHDVGIADYVLNNRNGGRDEFMVPDTGPQLTGDPVKDGEYEGLHDADKFKSTKHLSCLMPEHPGVAPITQTHVDLICRKIEEYKSKHPDRIAKYPDDEPANPLHDGNLCRGEWLVFWLKWAMKNCKNPVFYNS